MSNPKVFSLNYTLRSGHADGEIIESVDDNRSEDFLFGVGGLLPVFEQQINPLQAGDTFEFVVPAAEAYGVFEEESVIDLPKSAFFVEGELAEEVLFVGNLIPMADQMGNPLQGKVVEIGEEMVKMDFNHPLAGMDLHFKGTVVNSRAATAEEIQHGHIHSDDGCC